MSFRSSSSLPVIPGSSVNRMHARRVAVYVATACSQAICVLSGASFNVIAGSCILHKAVPQTGKRPGQVVFSPWLKGNNTRSNNKLRLSRTLSIENVECPNSSLFVQTWDIQQVYRKHKFRCTILTDCQRKKFRFQKKEGKVSRSYLFHHHRTINLIFGLKCCRMLSAREKNLLYFILIVHMQSLVTDVATTLILVGKSLAKQLWHFTSSPTKRHHNFCLFTEVALTKHEKLLQQPRTSVCQNVSKVERFIFWKAKAFALMFLFRRYVFIFLFSLTNTVTHNHKKIKAKVARLFWHGLERAAPLCFPLPMQELEQATHAHLQISSPWLEEIVLSFCHIWCDWKRDKHCLMQEGPSTQSCGESRLVHSATVLVHWFAWKVLRRPVRVCTNPETAEKELHPWCDLSPAASGCTCRIRRQIHHEDTIQTFVDPGTWNKVFLESINFLFKASATLCFI